MQTIPYHRKKVTSLARLSSGGSDLLFVDERNDQLQLRNVIVGHSIFSRLGLKNAEMRGCKLRHNVFSHCYLREARFTDVDFTGSVFENCNLERAKFWSCSLRYTSFRGCLLNVDEILGSLPFEPNLRLQVLRQLRTNVAELGQKDLSEKLLLKEIETDRQEMSNIVFGASSYYKERYSRWSRLKTLTRLIRHYLNDLVWGYGLRISRLLATGAIIVFLGALVIWGFHLGFVLPQDGMRIVLSFGDSLYVSAMTFLVAGNADVVPATVASRTFCALETLAGLVFLGFFVAALYRKIAR